MKKTINTFGSKLFLLALCLISGVQSFAQDAAGGSHTESATTSTATGPQWLNNPVIWIAAGALVFILILVAILSSRSSGKTQVSKTTLTTKVD